MQSLAQKRSTSSCIDRFHLASSLFKQEKLHLALKHIDSAIISGGKDNSQNLEFLVLKARILFAMRGRDREAFKLMKQVKRKSASCKGKNGSCRASRYECLFAKSLYYIGLWSFLTEDELNAVFHLKRYMEMASLHPSLRLPVQYSKQILRAAEAARIDPNCNKTSKFINQGRFSEAIEIVESVVKHAGLDMCDHWPLALGAKAYFALGKHHKARLYAARAFRSEPQCPDTVLIYGVTGIWSHSKSLSDKGEEALLSLLGKKVETLAFRRCGKGLVHAQRIRLAAMYGLALLYGMRGDFARANKFALRYFRAFKRYDAGEDKRFEGMGDVRKKIANGYSGISALCRTRLSKIFGYR